MSTIPPQRHIGFFFDIMVKSTKPKITNSGGPAVRKPTYHMSDPNNTLDLNSLRRGSTGPQPEPEAIGTFELPKATPPPSHKAPEQPANHPVAADAIRRRLHTIPSPHTVVHGDRLPAAPTAKLITDKHTLANRPDLAPATAQLKLPGFVIPLATALTVFLVVLVLFKAPVFVSQIGYTFAGPVASPTPAVSAVVPAENTV